MTTLNTVLKMPGTIGSAKLVFPWKEQMRNIAIIGVGYVGGAIRDAIESTYDASPILVDPAKGYTDTINDVKDAEGVFVCVPSPQGDDGRCDTSILESVLEQFIPITLNFVNHLDSSSNFENMLTFIR